MVEHNCRKKEELKRFNEQITKQDGMLEHKPRTDTNGYVYVGSLSLLEIAIGGDLIYSKFKKPEQNSIDISPPQALKTNAKPKRDIFEML